MLSLSTFVTRLSYGGKIKGAVHVPRGMLSSVPTPKAHTTIPLLGRRRPPSSIAHQAGARRSPEKRCKSLATSRSTMRALVRRRKRVSAHDRLLPLDQRSWEPSEAPENRPKMRAAKATPTSTRRARAFVLLRCGRGSGTTTTRKSAFEKRPRQELPQFPERIAPSRPRQPI
jgi:hypothetical protein